jgi:predicted ArsR family transcriptional regulator
MSRNKVKSKTVDVIAPTVSEWLSAMEIALHVGLDGGMTTSELSSALGISDNTVRIRLRKLFAEGRVIVGRRLTPCMTGKLLPTPVYKLRRAAYSKLKGSAE